MGIFSLILLPLELLGNLAEKYYKLRVNSKRLPKEKLSSFDPKRHVYSTGIKAAFIRYSNGTVSRFIMYGRSTYGERGTDILAAAVSTLAQNTALSIEKFAHADVETFVSEVYGKPYLEIKLNSFHSRHGAVQYTALINSLKHGLDDISLQYGDDHLEVMEL